MSICLVIYVIISFFVGIFYTIDRLIYVGKLIWGDVLIAITCPHGVLVGCILCGIVKLFYWLWDNFLSRPL